MSEQLLSRNQIEHGIRVWDFEWYDDIWATTLEQLKKAEIIPNKNYWKYWKRKVDQLLVDRRNKKNIRVIAVIEYKDIWEFTSQKDIKLALEQCNDLAQELWAVFWVAKDANYSIWINPKEENTENNYKDRTTWKERSYSFIRDEQRQKIQTHFNITEKGDVYDFINFDYYTQETYKVIERIINNVNKNNSYLLWNPEVDPTWLAQSVWQDIFVNTWRNPEACLYNVVELFIFKFLSDLSILQWDYSFEYVMEKIEKNWAERWLECYVRDVRPKIKELFPAGEDSTTIINWTIFVNSKWDPVTQNAELFASSLRKYEKFWNVKNVQKSFKSKLYEIFLKKDAWVKWLWQFFTPRKVIKQIVDMAQVHRLSSWSSVIDPFCWVWWFILETINNNTLRKDFELWPKWVNPKIKYLWYDKWNDEEDTKRTIILAKANMLIYLSDIIAKNAHKTQAYADIFNNTFKLIKDTNLWTLWILPKSEEDKFDLILTNPPYVKKGSRQLKKIIESKSEYRRFYKTNWWGTEWLAMERIVNNLKTNWRAFIIVPDWILNRVWDIKLRKFLIENCYINWIISLPKKTFFATPKKTYVLIITKKWDKNEAQDFPVFSYLASTIWESLDNHRLEEDANDLEDAKRQYLSYYWAEYTFQSDDPRCKLWDIQKLKDASHREIDRRWSMEEKISLWIDTEDISWTLDEFVNELDAIKDEIINIQKEIKDITQSVSDYETIDVCIGWEDWLFDIQWWFSFKKNLYTSNQDDIPIIRIWNLSEKNSKFVYYPSHIDVPKDYLVKKWDYLLALTWNFFEMKKRDLDGKFYLNQRVARFSLREDYVNNIDPDYFLEIISSIEKEVNKMWFSWNNNLRLDWEDWIKKIMIPIPVNENWEFDINTQKSVAKQYNKLKTLRKKLQNMFDMLLKFEIQYN